MTELSSSVASALVQYLQESQEKIHKIVEPLSAEQLWQKPYPYGNSIGHLLQHLTGNMNDRIAAQITGTDYKRNRPLEFTSAEKRPKEEVLADFDAAVAMVVDTMQKQSPSDWSLPYVAKTGPPARDRFAIFTRVLTHSYHHLGQIIYLSKELERQAGGPAKS